MMRGMLMAVAPLLLWALAALPAHAATVGAGAIEARAGDMGIEVPFRLTLVTTEQVSGIQFDLVFPPEAIQLNTLNAGPSATAAGKSVSFTETEAGRVRAIVAGLNQNVMESGVVVEGVFDVPVSAPNGNHLLALEGLVLSNPSGHAVPSTAEDGAITVSGGTNPAPPGCGCGTMSNASPGNPLGALLVWAATMACLYGLGKRSSRSTARACSRA